MTAPAPPAPRPRPALAAEVDLDAGPDVVPPRRRPLLAGAAVAALLAAVGAAGVRSVVTGTPAPPRPAVTAWVELRSVVADDRVPAVDLVVTVVNRTTSDAELTDVAVSGPRAAPATPAERVRDSPDVVRPLPAGGSATVTVRRPLACSTGLSAGRRDAGLDVRVRLGDADTLPALVVGRLAEADGACRAVAAAMPPGHDTRVTVTSASFTARTAQVRVAGLPGGAAVVEVLADGEPVPFDDVRRTAGQAGDVVLDLAAASSSCAGAAGADPAAGPVPVGLQLRLDGSDVPATAYAEIGPDLSRWLLATRARRCPAAVRG